MAEQNTGSTGLTLNLKRSSVYAVVLAFWCLQTLCDIVLFALFAFWTKFPGTKVLPRWLLIATLVAKVFAGIIHIIEFSLDLQGGETTQQLIIENIFWPLLYYTSRCSTYYIFYEFVHLMIENFKDLKRYIVRTRIIHWTSMAVIAITAIISWGLLTDTEIKTGTMKYTGHITSNIGQTVHGMICWAGGTEIMAWMIYLTAKSFKHHLNFKLKLFSCLLLFAAVAFASFSFFTGLYDLLYIAPGHYYGTDSTTILGTAIVTILEVIFDIIAWIVLLFCWARWAKIGEGERRVIERGPRENGPVEMGDSNSDTWLVEADTGLLPEVHGTSKNYHEADGITKGILESKQRPGGVFELDSRPRSHVSRFN